MEQRAPTVALYAQSNAQDATVEYSHSQCFNERLKCENP